MKPYIFYMIYKDKLIEGYDLCWTWNGAFKLIGVL